MLDDDGIDDAEEKAANARPRRAVPERRPREPNDPRSSVLTPTGAFAARDAAVFINRETVATAESATDALTRLETRVRLELRALHTAAKSAKDHVAEAFRRVDAFGAGVISRDAFAESLAALGVAVSAAEAAALCRAPALRELTLARNPLGGAGVAALGEGLRAATALETLDLSETRLDADGVEALGRAAVAGGLQVLWS